MTEAIYKFDEHLLKLSRSKDIEIAKKEWLTINSEKSTEWLLCICQHKIKKVVCMYNKYTQAMINVGVICFKKMKMRPKAIGNILLQELIKEIMEEKIYGIINDIDEYSEYIKFNFTHKIRNMYKNETNIDTLVEKKKQIQDLIHNYECNFLKWCVTEILFKIIEIRRESL
jgi:hypothetical protein